MKTILIAIPISKYIESETFKSIYDLEIPVGYQTEFRYFSGYQLDRTRNQIANISLNYDYLFFIDSDIVLPKYSLSRLISRNKEIVTGLYLKKTIRSIEYEVYLKNEKHRYIAQTNFSNDDLISIDGCGLGCCLIKTDIFKKIEYPYFLDTSLDITDRQLSEDLYFCRKSKRAGIELFADLTVICGHLGSYNFTPSNK